MDICRLLLYEVLNMPCKYVKFQNLGPFHTPFCNKIAIFFIAINNPKR